MRELEVLGNNHLKLDLADCKDFFEQELVEQVRIPECKSPKGQASLLRPERMATDMPERFSWRGRCKWRLWEARYEHHKTRLAVFYRRNRA